MVAPSNTLSEYLSAPRLARLLKLTTADLIELAERHNVRILTVTTPGRRPRVRFELQGVQRMVAELAQKPLAQADRVELAIAAALERNGIAPSPRSRKEAGRG